MGPTFVLILQLGLAGQRNATKSPNLTAAAQASGRPRECVTAPLGAAGRGINVWEAARDPNLDRYCDLVARGLGQLSTQPESARETADLADRASPGHAAPSVLRGRAYASAGRWADALSEFERARSLDLRSLDDPLTMREWARALAKAGRAHDALVVYRTLGPRVSILPSQGERARTFVEAAEIALLLGPRAIDDALAFLGEAKQLGVRELEWRVASSFALSTDRRGAREQATALAVDLGRRFRKSAKQDADSEDWERVAASALVLEFVDARLAQETWEKYVTHAGPWREHAEKRLEALRKKGRGG